MRAKVLSGITALVSFCLPSAPHILPPMRIIAGIEASTITSLGEWKLVMPLAESTIASSGRCSWQACRSRMISSRLDSGSVDLVVQVDHAVVDVDAELLEQLAVLLEGFLVEDLDAVAEDDRVRDLHHRGLDVQREQDAGLARRPRSRARRSRTAPSCS
jgi:hypothetical protein